MKRLWWLFCAALLCASARAAEYPPVNPGPVEEYGYGVQRTMHLLTRSTPEHRETVRILFYGQSITQQGWWWTVKQHLEASYPDANLRIENRAVGGYGAEIMVRLAETDLYPFYPDLVIFQVYGSLADYERLIRNIRERTTSEILIQTDHVTLDEELQEVTDPARAAEMTSNALKNYVVLPRISEENGAELVDVRSGWKEYLATHELAASELLKDHIHLNAHGEYVMSELVKPHLAYRLEFFSTPWRGAVRTWHAGRDFTWTNGVLELEFTGNRVDLVFESGASGSVTNLIDDQSPSEHGATYYFTRSSPPEGGNRPALAGIESEAKPLLEEWTLTITNWNQQTRQVDFYLEGSLTGWDGAGSSGERFVSDSGRVVLDPAAWGGARLMWWSVPPRPGFQITWNAARLGEDISSPATETEPGVEDARTIIQGIANGPHRLRLESATPSIIRAVRVYNPAGMVVNQEPHLLGARLENDQLVLLVRSQTAFQVERKSSLSESSSGWIPVGEPATGFAVPVGKPSETTFFRVRSVE